MMTVRYDLVASVISDAGECIPVLDRRGGCERRVSERVVDRFVQEAMDMAMPFAAKGWEVRLEISVKFC